jgi:hypothetical protein
VLVSVTGFLFHNTSVTPGMVIGAISLIILAVALFALYGRHLAGRWRAAYVIPPPWRCTSTSSCW